VRGLLRPDGSGAGLERRSGNARPVPDVRSLGSGEPIQHLRAPLALGEHGGDINSLGVHTQQSLREQGPLPTGAAPQVLAREADGLSVILVADTDVDIHGFTSAATMAHAGPNVNGGA